MFRLIFIENVSKKDESCKWLSVKTLFFQVSLNLEGIIFKKVSVNALILPPCTPSMFYMWCWTVLHSHISIFFPKTRYLLLREISRLPHAADLTPMGRSFYAESRLMTNDLIKQELGVHLRWTPTLCGKLRKGGSREVHSWVFPPRTRNVSCTQGWDLIFRLPLVPIFLWSFPPDFLVWRRRAQ